MSSAVKLIVDGFVKLNDRRALDEMREHRRKLREMLQERAGGYFDVSRSIELCDDDLMIVEEGLAQRVLDDPQDPYTRELLTAIPHPPLPAH